MLLNRTVAPASYPVTTAEAKAHLRLEHTDEDTFVDGLIAAATGAVEQFVGRPLITQTWAASWNGLCGKVKLPKAPVISVTQIDYYDADNAAQTDTVSNYYLFTSEDGAWMEAKPTFAWPTTYSREDGITITFVAGYGAASDVPTELKQAILLLIGQWHENREAIYDVNAGRELTEMPHAVQSLCGLYRLGWASA